MSVSASVLRAMLAAGCTAEQMVLVVELDEAESDTRAAKKRERDKQRQRRIRAQQVATPVVGEVAFVAEVASDTRDIGDIGDIAPLSPCPLSSPPTPPPIIPQTPNPPAQHHGERETADAITAPKPKKPKPPEKTPLEELMVVLLEEQARAVIGHRQRIGKPLTGYAAKLLAGKFGQCADPRAAADLMISNAWQGFEPEWVQNRMRAQPPPGAFQQGKPQKSEATMRHERILAKLDRRLGDEPVSSPAIDLDAADYRVEFEADRC